MSDELFHLSLNESRPTTIVLLHGLLSCTLEWESVTPHLSDYHLLVVDCPGHSKSSHIVPAVISNGADHVASLIKKHAHGGKAHVVGLSMGGFITLEVARRHPEVVLSAFATGAAPFEGSFKWMANHPSTIWYTMAMLDKMPEGLYWWLVKKKGMNRFDELKKEMSKNTKWDNVKDVYTSILDFGFEQVREIKVRTLAIAAGQEDQIEPTRKMGVAWKEEGVVGSKAVVVKSAVHAWDLQLPELFAEGILAWIQNKELPKEFEELI